MHRVADVVVAAVLTGSLLAVAGCTSPSQRMEMSRQTLVSSAVEGARLARLIDEGRAGGTFARTHAQELADDVQKVEEDLADHRTSGSEELLRLADEVDRALGSMTIKPTDHAVASAAEKTLKRLGARISGAAS